MFSILRRGRNGQKVILVNNYIYENRTLRQWRNNVTSGVTQVAKGCRFQEDAIYKRAQQKS